jgi:hypothetical protein
MLSFPVSEQTPRQKKRRCQSAPLLLLLHSPHASSLLSCFELLVLLRRTCLGLRNRETVKDYPRTFPCLVRHWSFHYTALGLTSLSTPSLDSIISVN